ncbi:MAG: hypothetical protein HZB16_01140 [Armatimonadetes bacterium]|nr:hypothetical protein [Armatimonadota bacterium]
MSSVSQRVFPVYRRWMAPLLSVTFVASAMVTAALCERFVLLAPALLVAYAWFVLNYLMLFGNGWLRRSLAQRLEALGEPADHRRARFVGLSYPCHNTSLGRRLVETDDDVGFLTIVPEGLIFHGDGINFTVPAAAIAGVRLVRTAYAPWARVEVTIADGEPFDEITLDSRNHAHHGACRRDNHLLAATLVRLAEGARPARARLTGEAPNPVQVSL